jgi:conjugal transfer pilin signal peptidase TrbI
MRLTKNQVSDYTSRGVDLAREVMASILKWKWVWIGGVSALLAFNHWFTLGINVSHSLPDEAFLVHKQDHDLHRGDYVTFFWHGGGPYPPGIKFTKIVLGVPGDVVTMRGRDVYINDKYISTAKTHSATGRPLALGLTGVIPEGCYYVHATHKDSLDSRYAITGWIKAETVIGKAQPIL